MTGDEFDIALANVPEGDRNALRAGLATPPPSAKFTEMDLLGEGGYACRLADLIGFDDIVAVFHQIANHGDLMAGLAEILKLLTRLRTIRVSVTGEEIRVLRAVKSGKTSENLLAEFLGVEPAVVGRIIEGLMAKTAPNEGSPLITRSDGILSTSV